MRIHWHGRVLALVFAAGMLGSGALERGELAPGPLAAQEMVGFDTTLYHAMKWRNVGPFRGGRSVAVAGVPGDRLTFYFGGAGGGVWKTTDAGVTWKNVTDGFLRTSSVGAIAVAESDPNVVYVGMGEHAIRGVTTSHGDGVYKSTDAGRTWTHLGLEATRAVSRIRVHPRNPDLVYVAAQGAPHGATAERGVYRSRDGGATWELVLHVDRTTGASDLAMDRTNPRILYAAMWDHLREPWVIRSGGPGSGIWKSTDGGDRWERLENGLPEMGKVAVDVSPADPDRVWALVEGGDDGGVYRSDDAGKSWSLTSSERVTRARAWYYIEIYADPQDRETVYVMNSPFLRSIDGGKTFETVETPHVDHHDLWIDPLDNRVMISANDGGATISFNAGETWSTQQNQPTAQIYRLTTDNRFPYWLYGGQQDNTSVAISGWVTHGGGIGWKDWFDAGGGESAWVAFDPDDPRYLYATSIQGFITELDTRDGSQRSIRAYPEFALGMNPEDMRYRWNWNAPVVVSPHDPDVLYHGAQVLLRSGDRGNRWTEISPDLTRNQTEKHGSGGVPFTNEAAGGEVYNTIMYVVESPHEPGTIWVGTDDGLVQLTRDGGRSWANVTPPGLGEGLVNSIEVSPHAPGVAYLAFTRYKFDDRTPHIFRTSDYGQSWTRAVAGIAPEAWVRAVREDPVRRGLLYAGTELGMYVSFDAGESWGSLQLGLPVTPITDLRVQSGDLVAATQGRSFWILDDLSPLHQLDEGAGVAEAYLFAPRPAYRVNQGLGGPVGPTVVGENAPGGALIDYTLAEGAAPTVRLEILDASGDVIRTFSSDTTAADDGRRFSRAPAKPGHNRLVWDLRREGPPPIPGALPAFGGVSSYRVMPGTYTVRLSVGETVATATLEVRGDPRLDPGETDFAANKEFLGTLARHIEELHQGVRDLRGVREQVGSLLERTDEVEGGDTIEEAGSALSDSLSAVEDRIVQTRRRTQQDMVNFAPLLATHLSTLMGEVDGTDLPPTAGARERLDDLGGEWAREKAALDHALGELLDAFNQLVREAGIPAVILRRERRAVS